jgi:amino acid adenylation domain-containing protein
MLSADPGLALAERRAGEPATADGTTLVELFQAQAARTPAAEALVHGSERLTYDELNRRANRLAHLLRAQGIGPEARVAVLLERSPRMVTTLLAILKAGGAYVPLDPAWPRERTTFALEDSGAALLVTAGSLVPEQADALQVLDLDREAAVLAAQAETDPPGAPDPQTLAYLLYTSGSTGQPKAVAVEHRSTANLIRWAAGFFAPEEMAGMLFPTSICFDVSVFELFVPLCLGGKVILAQNLLELPLLAAADEVTFVSTVPSLLAELVRRGPLPRSVRTIGLAGEALRRDLCDRIYAQPSGTAVYNLYGPTEATTYATAARIARDEAGPPPIGRTLDGLRVHVLDRELRPLPAGESGELFIAGEGVARCYLGRPDQTAAAFLPEPSVGDGKDSTGARMYRTGDLVRWRKDGQLEYLGRIDGQVKVHGLRIEPGEIESVLDRHPAVRCSVVVAREDRPGDKRLVAYVVLSPGPPPSARDLLQHLAGSLPSYMVPADCVFLEALPLTPSGKLDRRALPAPPLPSETAPHARVPPRDPVETAVAEVCADILGLAEIGVTDDFFALGGNSLHAAMVLSRVSHRFDIALPAQTLLVERTVAGLARAVSAGQGDAGGPGVRDAALVRVTRDRPLPLTFGQERLWFLHRLEPGSPVYNLPVAYDVPGPLDAGALARAVAGVAGRHEVLRTTYAEIGGEVVQILHPPPAQGLPLVDLTGLAPTRRAGERERITAAEARRPFDLVLGPVWRPLLLRLAQGEHRLLLTVHHIAADAWSLGVLAAELRAGYSAGGQAATFPAPAVQVADFAAWQRAWLRDAVLDDLLSRWTARLAGAPTALDLPADRPRPPVRSDRGGVRQARLAGELGSALQNLGQREGATPYMVLLTALAALLGRWTGQRDFLVGTPFAGRNRAELEGLIGFFVNTLVVRCDLGGASTFRGLLARVREECLAAHAAQDLPFEKLVERLQPQRDPSRNPLFQVLFVLQNAPDATGATGSEGLPLEPVGVEAGTAKFDLTLEVAPAGKGFRLRLEYSADLFDAPTIERLAGHYERLLAEAVARPDEEVGRLTLTSGAERHQLLREWNDTATGGHPPGCLHQLVEGQVDRTPDAVAVVFDGQSLTYGELDRRANRLAHHLLRLGVQPDSPVGVCAERSLELEIALLAILKAGAAYVPLDPEYPRDRLAYMLKDALGDLAAPVLLTQGRLLAALPATGARIVLLDELPGEGEEPSHRPAVPVHPDQVAYLIYTSGSTGRPKGVMSSHRGIANRLLWVQETYRLDGSDRVLQKTPASFDVSVWEFFWPLLAGARLVMALPGGHRDPVYLARAIAEEGVTTIHFVPSMLSLFLASAEVERATSLRLVVCSGEALSYDLQQRFQARLGCRLDNLYGPTEASVDVTFWTCRRAGPPVVPIGRPVANTRIHLLDPGCQPVPVGAPGELHIGGIQLARGYWRRPELTAERFVPDPCGEEPGSRLYKTGDLARHRPDGAVEFLGRLDHQVKVRGIRVELGEIEAVLAEHPEVAEAVVAARGTGGDTRLVAWVVPAADAAPDRHRLRTDLKARLPEPMVPTAWVFLPSLPLTPSGKVDRRALPEPEAETRGTDAPFVAPRTPVEDVVAGIWGDVLGVEAVGTWDDFFALGGHSLLASRVASRLGAAFGVEIPLRRLFEAPTLAALTEVVETSRRDGSTAPAAPPIEPAPREAPLPLSFAQERLWFLDRLTPGLPVYNLPVLFTIDGPLDAGALAQSWNETVRRHEALRTTFAEGPCQIIAPPAPLLLRCHDLSGLAEPRRAGAARELVAELSRQPFDLAAGPLARLFLLRLAPEEHQMLLVAHHIVCDGWSLEVLAAELASTYRTALAGEPPPLVPLPIQYADFAVWQRRWLAGVALEAPLRFWRERLRNLPEVLDLPLDRPRPPMSSYRGGVRSRALPAGLSTALRQLGRREGATLFMTFLAGFAALLHRLTGQTDLPVGTPVANRDRPEIEPLLGLFVNTLVLRCDAADDPSFSTLLARVRETALAAYAHQELPFERLVAELRPRRELSHAPLFQVLLLVEAVRQRELAPGVRLRELLVDNGTAKFDLTFHVLTGEGELTASVEYNGDLFDPTTAERLLALWAVLLEGAAAAPARPLSELPLLPPSEAWQVLGEWSQVPSGTLPPVTVHELFAAQAARTPDAVALQAGGETTTYRELDARASRLAQRLRSLGIGPDMPVGVTLGRSQEMVTALLAVLKAGGAYVPLDPASPRPRLAGLLADSGVRALVTLSTLLPLLPELPAGVPVLCLDTDEHGRTRAVTDGSPCSSVSVGARPCGEAHSPLQLAYVLYTSGSTGRPKGVAVPHCAIVRLILGDERARPDQAFLQYAPLPFDVSTLEIWEPLLSGGRLVLAPPGLLSVDELVAVILDGGVTDLWLTAGLFHQAAEEGLERLHGLRRLLAGGDVLSPGHCRRALAALPGTVLIDGYGPTENTTFTTCHPMNAPEEVGPSVSIGRPIPWTSVLVVDRNLRPVPIGVAGELVTGGLGLARGYHGRPDLTAERFVPDPLSGEPGARLYRTGDLVRWRADGTLEFFGRLDRQVKIRGFRIEPAEVESALGEHPDVRAAAVVPSPHPSGDRTLVAWVEPAEGAALSVEDLRGFLAERLPGFMIPSLFQVLPALPLTASGKVDRRSLPEPDWEAAGRPEGTRGPGTPLEELVAGIWAEVLGRERVGRDEDFFVLGGHSLLATRVASRLRAALGVEVPLRHLFESPTAAALAATLEALLRGDAPAPPPPLNPVPRTGGLPLSFGQQRLWFLDQLEPGNPTFNIPLASRLSGPVDAAALAWSLAEVIRRHEVLRTTFAQQAGEVFQVIAPPAAVAPGLPLIDLQALPEETREGEARRLAAEDGRRPFDLARGPLLRSTLVHLAPEESWLFLCLHHIAADGWSLDVLLDELGACYAARLAGLPSPLPPLPVQYADFAVWQRGWLQGEALDRRLEPWRSRLGGPLPVLDLAPGRPVSTGLVRRGGLLTAELPAALAEVLRRFARQQGATLFMVLLAAFGELLRRWTGATDLLVGTPVSRRDVPALEPLIGFFVDTLVLRLDVAGDPDFRTLAGRVREVALGAYTHGDLPFDKLVDELQPHRAAGASPLFQVMFALHTPRREAWTLGDARLTPVEIHNGTSQFDWTLYVVDRAGALVALLEYDRDRVGEAEARRALAHYGELLEAAVAHPERPLSALAPLPLPARQQVAAEVPPPAGARPDRTGRRGRIAEMRGQLTPEQRALLERRLQGGGAPAVAQRISLVSIEPAGDRPPLVCVHPAGGDVLCFRGLARHLGPGQPVIGLQSRGLVEGQEPHCCLPEMAASYIAELRKARPEGPYLLCGWSLGGLVAYEMAQQLRASGARVPLLALFDSVPRLPVPDAREAEDEEGDTPWLLDIADYVGAMAGKPLGMTRDELQATADPEERLRRFTERLAKADLLPPGGTVEHLRRLLRVFRANVRAGRQYVPVPWPGRLTLFRAEEGSGTASDPTLGWGALAAGPVDVQGVPGSHLTLLAEPCVQTLAARLRAAIDTALGHGGSR